MRAGIFYIILFAALIQSVAFSQSLRSLVNDGVEKYNEKKFTDSEISFRKGAEKDPNSFDAVFNLGDSYFKQEKYDDAIKYYQQALSKTQDKELKAETHYNIGNALLKSRKLKESIESYKNSLKLNPNDREAKYNLSYALKLLQNEQNQNQNKDKNQDKNQDKNKDQNKDDQNKQENKDKQNKEQQQQQPPPKMSKEEAQQILNAMKENEKDLQKQLRKKVGVKVKTDKDW